MKKRKIQLVLAVAIAATLSGSIMGQVAFATENTVNNKVSNENEDQDVKNNTDEKNIVVEEKNNEDKDIKDEVTGSVSKTIPVDAWNGNKVLMEEVCKRTKIDDISKVTYDDIKKIDELNLTRSLYAIPEILKEFTGLTKVDLSYSPEVESALNYLYNAKGLKQLNLDGVGTINLDKVAENFKELERIDIAHNKYGELPDAIYKMENLKMIYADGCEISTISPEISKLKQLKTLSLENNNISKLPDEFGELQSLNLLDLQKNKFDEIPLVLFKITKMGSLYMGHNNLISIPKEIINMQGDESGFMLQVGFNQIASLPETKGQTIQCAFNFLPYESDGQILELQLSLMQNTTIQLKENEKLTQERLRDLVWINSDEVKDIKLDNKHKLELVIDGKIVSGEDVAKLPKGRYEAGIKLVGADINNKNANAGTINLEIGDVVDLNNENINEDSKDNLTEANGTNTTVEGLTGKLPKTGGVAAASIALLGVGALGAGLTIIKKRRK